MIDYGTIHFADINSIKYMMRGETTQFPVAAIECELHFPPEYTAMLIKKKYAWQKEARDKFLELVDDRILGITFHRRKEVTVAGQKEVNYLVI